MLGDGLLCRLVDCEVATGLPGLLLDGTTELLRGVGAAVTGVTTGLLREGVKAAGVPDGLPVSSGLEGPACVAAGEPAGGLVMAGEAGAAVRGLAPVRLLLGSGLGTFGAAGLAAGLPVRAGELGDPVTGGALLTRELGAFVAAGAPAGLLLVGEFGDVVV